MAKDNYYIIERFLGYNSKRDITKLEPGTLVRGSVNVVSTDIDGIAHRPGFSADGEVGDQVDQGIQSAYTWDTNTKGEIALRAGDEKLQVRVVAENGDVSWTTILDNLPSTKICFDRWYDATEQIDVLLFVNGTSDISAWSGGTASIDIDNSTATTLILEDTPSNFLEKRFFQNAIGGSLTYDKKLTIDGIEYTYTGGEGTNTLTGVSPSPLLGGHDSIATAFQSVTVFAGKPGVDAELFSNDILVTLYNQVWIASTKNSAVYIADQTDFTSFALQTAANRSIGDPQVLFLDGNVKALVPDDEKMNISAGTGFWYTATEQLSADQSEAVVDVRLLKTGAQQAALSNDLTFKLKNAIAFVSEGRTLDQLGSVENFNTRQNLPISDPIKYDFDRYDFENGQGIFWKNKMYVALPNESRLLIYDIETSFWEAPWIVPARSLSIIGGDLYMHSNTNMASYKLYSGKSDDGKAIITKAIFSYINNGDRVNLKQFSEKYTEGFITSNTEMYRTDRIEWRGVDGASTINVNGNNQGILLYSFDANPLGSNPLGDEPLGTSNDEQPEKARFRSINSNPPQSYRELQVEFGSNQVGGYWEVNAFGNNTINSSKNNSSITK